MRRVRRRWRILASHRLMVAPAEPWVRAAVMTTETTNRIPDTRTMTHSRPGTPMTPIEVLRRNTKPSTAPSPT